MILIKSFILCLLFLPTVVLAQQGPTACDKFLRRSLNIINYPQLFEMADAGLARRSHRRKALQQIRQAEQIESLSESSVSSLYLGAVREKDWDYSTVIITEKAGFGEYSINEYSLSEFTELLMLDVPVEIKHFVPQIIEALLDVEAMDSWISELRKEQVEKMWFDGVLNLTSIQQVELVEYYLDKTLAERASRYGFLLNDDGSAKDILTTSAGNFFRGVLAYGYFFTDWTGATLRHSGSDIIHSVRGHSLQMAYLAERVPEFVEFIKFIGRSKDRKKIFYRLLDNGRSAGTAFHPGGMVDVYGDFLGIEK